jgi:hypothetical protein
MTQRKLMDCFSDTVTKLFGKKLCEIEDSHSRQYEK